MTTLHVLAVTRLSCHQKPFMTLCLSCHDYFTWWKKNVLEPCQYGTSHRCLPCVKVSLLLTLFSYWQYLSSTFHNSLSLNSLSLSLFVSLLLSLTTCCVPVVCNPVLPSLFPSWAPQWARSGLCGDDYVAGKQPAAHRSHSVSDRPVKH